MSGALRPRYLTAGLVGSIAIFLSAFCFYLSTVVIRWSQEVTAVTPAYFVLFRFVLGFAVVVLVMAGSKIRPRPRRWHLLLGRTVFNCVAVFCFYQGVAASSVAEANILNMTYPIFVAALSWVLPRQQRDRVSLAMVIVACAGIWLILSPTHLGLKWGNLWALMSGIAAAAAILYLNVARQHHDTFTILFYMFGPGAAIMFVLFYREIFWPDPTAFRFLMACGGLGVLGQFLLTLGFRHVTAMEGSIISSTRILLAGLLGPWLAADPALGAAGWLGALLIFGANVVLALRKGRTAGPSVD